MLSDLKNWYCAGSFMIPNQNNKQEPFIIGLVFPEIGKRHTCDYFTGLLDRTKLDLLVFPEGFETIKSVDSDIAPVNGDDRRVKAVLKQYASIATKYDIGVIFGFQVDYGNGKDDQYSAYLNPKGDNYIYHKHSTSIINAFFDPDWSIENNIRNVHLKGFNIGISICHDSYISLISRLLSKNGADIWINISYQNVRPNIWEPIHLTRAVENDIISLCTLHRNSKASNSQKDPYAFSSKGKIRLKDIKSNKYIDDLPENKRTGKIYIFDYHNYKNYKDAFTPPDKSALSPKADKLSITKKDGDSIKLSNHTSRIVMEQITMNDYFAPEVLWKLALKHLGKTVIYIIHTGKDEWPCKRMDVLKTIKGRAIEFSTAFIFLEDLDSIRLCAYRSSNYKDSRMFIPNSFPITIDSRYLFGIKSTCDISLGDYRNRKKNGKLYFERIKKIIMKIESL